MLMLFNQHTFLVIEQSDVLYRTWNECFIQASMCQRFICKCDFSTYLSITARLDINFSNFVPLVLPSQILKSYLLCDHSFTLSLQFGSQRPKVLNNAEERTQAAKAPTQEQFSKQETAATSWPEEVPSLQSSRCKVQMSHLSHPFVR